MSKSAFPIEILEFIIEDYISEVRDPHLNTTELKFFPYWQYRLLPLLRVCKTWHTVSERLMYHRVSLGGEIAGSRKRFGHEVATDFLAMLSTNPRIASLVKELQLAIRDVQHTDALECTRTNLRILQLCQNVRHVEIRGFHRFESDTLVELLMGKSKSLVSLCITPHSLTTQSLQGATFQLLKLMKSLPKLRSIKVDGIPPFEDRNEPKLHNTPEPSPGGRICCPDLQEIRIIHCALHYSDLDLLSSMTKCVKDFGICTRHWSCTAALLGGLCRCLRAWSPTLERLTLRIDRHLIAYPQFQEALSCLKALQELELNGSLSDFSAIANLPSLERLCFKSDWMITEGEMKNFAAHLEDFTKLPALKHIVVGYPQWEEHDKEFRDLCLRRGILFEARWHENYIPSYVLWH